MRFEYKKNRYESEQMWVLVLFGAIGLLVMATLSREVGMGIVVVGVLLAVVLRWHGATSNRFVFELGEAEIRVTLSGKTIVFGWKDVAIVVEDERSMTFTLRGNGLALPILNDMDGYDKFKHIVMDKAHEYQIQTRMFQGGTR